MQNGKKSILKHEGEFNRDENGLSDNLQAYHTFTDLSDASEARHFCSNFKIVKQQSNKKKIEIPECLGHPS